MFEECRVEGDFQLSSNRKTSVLYDFEKLTPAATVRYVNQLIEEIPNYLFEEVDFVASPSIGGIVPGFLIALTLGKRFVIVDKDSKIRGPFPETGSYLVVDDVISSFGAANFTIDALGKATCLGVAAYIFKGSDEDLDNSPYSAFYLERKEQEV